MVEAALVVCILGVGLAVFIPTFLSKVQTSKIGEASTHLAQIYRSAASYYESAQPLEGDEGVRHRCLPPLAGPTPAMPTEDAARVDFAAEGVEGAATWSALAFSPEEPLRYSYTFTPVEAGCGVEVEPGRALITIEARGDLDGDGQTSLFERSATLDEDGLWTPLGLLYVSDRVE